MSTSRRRSKTKVPEPLFSSATVVFLEIRPDPPGVSRSNEALDNRRASLSLICRLVDNLASVERVLGRGRSIGQRLFIGLAESHLVRTAPCLIPAQVDVMHDPI